MEWDLKTQIQRWVMIKERWPWWLTNSMHKITCLIFGHTPERDQCNNPEHDYCLWCRKSMPNSWKPEEHPS